jgi:hypothetical protein
MALVAAIKFAQRFGHGAQVGQEPAQDLGAGDGHAWPKLRSRLRSMACTEHPPVVMKRMKISRVWTAHTRVPFTGVGRWVVLLVG